MKYSKRFIATVVALLIAALVVWCERDAHVDRHALISGLDDASLWLRRKYHRLNNPTPQPPPMTVFPAPPVITASVMARWSNDVLVAVLPQISDCVKALDLPIPLPITTGQVAQFAYPTPGWTHYFEGTLILTNGYSFNYWDGMVSSFISPDSLETLQDRDVAKRFKRLAGKDNMTTNEAIDLARNTFVKLGYNLAELHMDGPPEFDRPYYDTPQYGHLPFCQVGWRSPASETNRFKSYSLELCIDMKQKRVVGMSIAGMRLWRPVPRIDFTPEQESDLTTTNALPTGTR
jgi:hypothetical protein